MNSAGCDALTPCGPPSITTSLAPATVAAVRFPLASKGTIGVAAKEATRSRVLDAARTQLEKLGFEGTSVRGIALAAGVAIGTVLLHFPDKKQLLHAAMFEDLEDTWERAKGTAGKRARAWAMVLNAHAPCGAPPDSPLPVAESDPLTGSTT